MQRHFIIGWAGGYWLSIKQNKIEILLQLLKRKYNGKNINLCCNDEFCLFWVLVNEIFYMNDYAAMIWQLTENGLFYIHVGRWFCLLDNSRFKSFSKISVNSKQKVLILANNSPFLGLGHTHLVNATVANIKQTTLSSTDKIIFFQKYKDYSENYTSFISSKF